ncbi:MAG: enamine deaminase RidA (YjgF/YER057c/UK114 family), partial [Octadecabacter sp.]
MSIEAQLAKLGIILPDAPAPAANYMPWVRTGNLLFISGQIATNEDGFITGKLGENMTVEDGAVAAKACAVSLLAQ